MVLMFYHATFKALEAFSKGLLSHFLNFFLTDFDFKLASTSGYKLWNSLSSEEKLAFKISSNQILTVIDYVVLNSFFVVNSITFIVRNDAKHVNQLNVDGGSHNFCLNIKVTYITYSLRRCSLTAASRSRVEKTGFL